MLGFVRFAFLRVEFELHLGILIIPFSRLGQDLNLSGQILWLQFVVSRLAKRGGVPRVFVGCLTEVRPIQQR